MSIVLHNRGVLCGADFGNTLALGEHALLTAVDDLVGASVVGVEVSDLVLGIQIVLQISVGQIVGEVLEHVLDHGVGIKPGLVTLLGIGRKEAVLLRVLLNLRDEVMALFIVDVLEPTEVIEAKVHGLRLAHIATEQATVRAHEVNGLVADVEDAMLIGQDALETICHNSSRVGVVDNPRLRAMSANIVDDLNHVMHGAHTVSHAARAHRFLADDSHMQRNLLVLAAHLVAAGTNLAEHKVDVGVSLVLIGGVTKLHTGLLLSEEDLAKLADRTLTLGVDVIEHHAVQRQNVHVLGQGFKNARAPRGAAANDHNIELILHVPSLQGWLIGVLEDLGLRGCPRLASFRLIFCDMRSSESLRVGQCETGTHDFARDTDMCRQTRAFAQLMGNRQS